MAQLNVSLLCFWVSFIPMRIKKTHILPMRKLILNMPFEIIFYVLLWFYALRDPLLWTFVYTQIPATHSPLATISIECVAQLGL